MNSFCYGIIEGFYGREWSNATRQKLVPYWQSLNVDCYIYAPKSARWLRSDWDKPAPKAELDHLAQLRGLLQQAEMRFGVALSPINLAWPATVKQTQLLQEKVQQLVALKPDIFCILFDDINGDKADLAAMQRGIIGFICALLPKQTQVIICPTYYSFDPILEKLFGAMPNNYLQELGQLDKCIDIFWTGDKVLSSDFSIPSIELITDKINRKPMLWDNYPVNDGNKSSKYLHLKSFTGRPKLLSNCTAGHMVNPMNQAWLSLLAIYSLNSLYYGTQRYDSDRVTEAAITWLANGNNRLQQLLLRDWMLFHGEGLDNLQQKKQQLIDEYSMMNTPAADEVVGWLKGDYTFDPACLT